MGSLFRGLRTSNAPQDWHALSRFRRTFADATEVIDGECIVALVRVVKLLSSVCRYHSRNRRSVLNIEARGRPGSALYAACQTGGANRSLRVSMGSIVRLHRHEAGN